MSNQMTVNQQVAKLRKLTIRQAETSDDSRLFVINQAKPQRGNINITVGGHGGEKHTIQAPATFIPVDLSNQLEKDLILRNPNFRRIHASGHVCIVHGDDAEAFLQRPEVQREYQRIYGAHANIVQSDSVVVEQGNENLTNQGEATLEERAIKDGINPFIVNMLNRAETGENPADLISELDAQLTTLDIASVRFLADNCAVAPIKEWATEAVGLLG